MMDNAVIAIYLVKLLAAVLGVMAIGCFFEYSTAVKSGDRG